MRCMEPQLLTAVKIKVIFFWKGDFVYYGRHTPTFKNMLVQVPPKRRPKIQGVTSQKTARNLVCCYVYINHINVRLALTRRMKWTGNRLQQAREDKNTQNVTLSETIMRTYCYNT